MLYLKISLTGEAEGFVQHFATTAANNDDAWRILNERYENKRVLVNTLIKKLLAQPLSTTETIASFKSLHDTTQECLHSLKNLGISTNNWDPLLLHILVQKLHKNTHTLWEHSVSNPHEFPKLQDFLQFIKTRFQSLEALGSKSTNNLQTQSSMKTLSATVSSINNCDVCHGNHQISSCQKFLNLSARDRLAAVQKAKRCVNCLKSGHRTKNCKSSFCTKCNKRNNALLHFGDADQQVKKQESTSKVSPPIALSTVQLMPKDTTTILSTVCVLVTDCHRNKVKCRGLLDSGSQWNLITKHLAKRLGFKSNCSAINKQGIGQSSGKSNERINVEISSISANFSIRLDAHVLQKIVTEQPNCTFYTHQWNLPKNINLSDTKFNIPGQIDLLIGAGVFYSILLVAQIKLGENLPILQNTLFGWVVGGSISQSQEESSVCCGIGINDESLHTNMERFWQLEERDDATEHTQREADGRFTVKLPFEPNINRLGDSSTIAKHGFMAIERKLPHDPAMRSEYVKFMRKYESLNHMKEISPSNITGAHYFLPHHAVGKADSTTTKLRVVFDASAKTSTNVSLNDILAAGPTIQTDVFTILMRFRLPRFAFTAYIEKMYRQIWVHEDDKKFQLIWWREDPNMPLRCMQLATYGTTSAPFLAIRSLQQLALSQDQKYPLAAEAIKNNFYVDDILCGSDSMITALELQKQLLMLLKSAGFNLRKWCSNDA